MIRRWSLTDYYHRIISVHYVRNSIDFMFESFQLHETHRYSHIHHVSWTSCKFKYWFSRHFIRHFDGNFSINPLLSHSIEITTFDLVIFCSCIMCQYMVCFLAYYSKYSPLACWEIALNWRYDYTLKQLITSMSI